MTLVLKANAPSEARIRSAAAFTLVELLVATAVTLLLILAITQAFAVVGDTVSSSRAVLEMVSQLRSASIQFQEDAAGITTQATPWVSGSGGEGYLEIIDGNRCDLNADPFGDSTADPYQNDADTSWTDWDDAALFTARSQSLFFGRYEGQSISANLAECVWMSGNADLNGDGVVDSGVVAGLSPKMGERFVVYRRLFLVRPDLNSSTWTNIPVRFMVRFPRNPATPHFDITNPTDMGQLADELQAFYNENDISVRFYRQLAGNNLNVFAIANSASDLILRQNRAGRQQIASGGNGAGAYVPPATHPFPFLPSAIRKKSGDRLGEDVVLSNSLGFDLRVFDPAAVVSYHRGADAKWGNSTIDDDNDGTVDNLSEAGWPGSDDEIVSPGDVGFGWTTGSGVGSDGTTPINGTQSIEIAGAGTFVDLNYGGKLGITNPALVSNFSTLPHLKSYFGSPGLASAVWDTWPLEYERDGVDQDLDMEVNASGFRLPDGIDNNSNGLIDELLDEGTDGLDNDGANGVDDLGERETSPPYLFPLRGIQARFRMIDMDTRQVRQTSVTIELSRG